MYSEADLELFARFVIVLACVQLIYSAGLLTACWIQRMPVTRIEVFNFGPRIARWSFGGIEIVVGTIPLNVSVTIEGMSPDEAHLLHGFSQRSRLGRASIWISSVLAILVVGMMICGIPVGVPRFWSSMGQVLSGACAPLSLGKGCVLRYFNLLERGSLMASIGALCITYAALCLSPLPMQNLFRAVIELLSTGKKNERLMGWVGVWSVLITILFWEAWFVALTAASLERVLGNKPNVWLVSAIVVGVSALAMFGQKGREKAESGTGQSSG